MSYVHLTTSVRVKIDTYLGAEVSLSERLLDAWGVNLLRFHEN